MRDDVTAELARLRASIDNMDAALVHLLAERFKITQQVGELKAAHGLPPADPVREAQQIARLRALAEEARLDPEFAEKFLGVRGRRGGPAPRGPAPTSLSAQSFPRVPGN